MRDRTVRSRLGAALGAAVLVAALVGMAAVPASAHSPADDPNAHNVVVTPSTNLVNNQVVSVTADGYSPGQFVLILQCNPDPAIPQDGSGCNLGSGSGFSITNASGQASGSVTVKTGQVGTSPLAQCPPTAAQQAAGISCIIAVAPTDGSHSGRTNISFLPPPSLTVTPDHARAGGTLTLSGASWASDQTSSDLTVELCEGATCSASDLSVTSLSTDGSGALTGAATVNRTTACECTVKVTQTSNGNSASDDVHVLGAPSVTAFPTSGGPGTTVTLTGSNWNPNASVNVVVLGAPFNGSVLGSFGAATVNAHGQLSGSVTIQASDGAIAAPNGTLVIAVSDSASPFTLNAQAQFSFSSNVCVGPCDLDQTIVQPVAGDVLTFSQDEATVTLSSVTLDGTTQESTGALNTVTVSDARGSLVGWSVTAVMTDLSDGTGLPNHSIPASNLEWAPACAGTDLDGDGTLDGLTSQVLAGSTAALDDTVAVTLCTAAAGGGGGSYDLDADLTLVVPATVAAATYSATLTLTVA